MKILIPFTPHMAYECLEMLGEKEIKNWPKIDPKLILKEKIQLAIQINGKKDMNQTSVEKICRKNEKIKNKVSSKSINKIIFVKNRIINFILKK